MDHPFRTAAVGGFNRQDVLTFLEASGKENAERLQDVQKQLDEARESGRQKDRELEELHRRLTEAEELQTRLEETEKELEDCRSRLAQADRDSSELQRQVSVMRPGAEAYDAIKDRTAGVELEAHHRAQMVLEEAQNQAADVHAQVEQWMKNVERDYDRLRAAVNATVAHAAEQLDRAGQSLGDVTAFMERQNVSFHSMVEGYNEKKQK